MRSTRSDGSPAWTLIGVHLTLSLERSLEVRMMALATAVGAIVEMSQIATGTYHFTSGTAWLGAAGGPLAFLAGERLGAVALLPPVTHGLLRLSISWAIAFAIFSAVVRRLTPERNAPPFSSTR